MLRHASQYQVYITDIMHRKDSDIAKEWRKQRKVKEQEELKLRKIDLDKREAALNSREAMINAGLNTLKAQIDSLQADLKPKQRKVHITIKNNRPVVAISMNESPVPYTQSAYIKPNGIVDNIAIGNLVYSYMKEHNAIMSPKDIESWLKTYCPIVSQRWTSVAKGASNILGKNLKDRVVSVGRGKYTAI
jgi:hypothetical protein